MFKDIRNLQKQAKDISKDWDPAAQMRQANTRMQQATASMAAATSAASLLSGGEAARAQVVAIQDTGIQMNFQPVLKVDVLVMPAAGPPFPSSTEGPISPAFLPRLTPGAELGVRYDPAKPDVVAIDWTVA